MSNPKRNNGDRVIGSILSLTLIASWHALPIHAPAHAALTDPAAPAARAAASGMDRPAAPDQALRTRATEAFGKLPLMFEANAGQSAREVKFLARGPGYKLFLTADEAVMVLGGARDADPSANGRRGEGAQATPASPSTLRMKLVGANPRPRVEGQEELTARTNYFIGSDPREWRTEGQRLIQSVPSAFHVVRSANPASVTAILAAPSQPIFSSVH